MSDTQIEPLTLERAKELARQAVAERGEDYVYVNPLPEAERRGSCMYVHGDEPGCLVGVILHKHGVPLKTLSRYERQGVSAILRQVFDSNHDPEVDRFLGVAQSQQDEGNTWGEALRAALEAVED